MRWREAMTLGVGGMIAGLVACGEAPPGPAQAPGPAASASASAAARPRAFTPPDSPDAKPLAPEEAVTRLFTAPKVSPAWFAPSFLAMVPIERIDPILADMKRSLGAFVRVEKSGSAYGTVFEKGTVPTDVTLDDAGRFAGLFFHAPVMKVVSLEESVAAFKILPGQVHLLVLADGAERGSVNPDLALAVGSAFKLAILAALREEVTAKKRGWSEVVELKPEWKSLPSGFLQQWPDKTPITLGTLASLMISQSDNTAADALLDIAGRAAVEKLAPRDRPFLSTREAFLLKDPASSALLERFRKGDEAARRAVLGELKGKPLPSTDRFGEDPRALDVEWTFSAREMCDLMKKVADLPLMAINPGVASPSEWDRVAYKGGSEPGVLNFTSALEKGGKHYCVAATWNDKAKLDEMRFVSAYRQLLSSLR